MIEQDNVEQGFNAATARILRRETLRRAASELSTTTAPGLEHALSRISAEVTEDAVERLGGGAAPAKGHGVPAGRLPKPG